MKLLHFSFYKETLAGNRREIRLSFGPVRFLCVAVFSFASRPARTFQGDPQAAEAPTRFQQKRTAILRSKQGPHREAP
jgi:hypothetical protein